MHRLLQIWTKGGCQHVGQLQGGPCEPRDENYLVITEGWEQWLQPMWSEKNEVQKAVLIVVVVLWTMDIHKTVKSSRCHKALFWYGSRALLKQIPTPVGTLLPWKVLSCHRAHCCTDRLFHCSEERQREKMYGNYSVYFWLIMRNQDFRGGGILMLGKEEDQRGDWLAQESLDFARSV